jgi:hypothetical protein
MTRQDTFQRSDTNTTSELRYRAVCEITAQIVMITNDAGEVIEPAEHWTQLTGQTVAASLGLG